jgi:ABC-type transport system involved in cytochrome c biogenesis permease subunit
MLVERITLFCFQASYGVSLALELLQLLKPRPLQRLLALGFGSAGLLAHTLFLVAQGPPLASQFGSMLFLAWILAIFYLYGSVHHRRVAWGVFVLPVVLGLLFLARAWAQPQSEPSDEGWLPRFLAVQSENQRFWGILHVILLLLAAVGACVGFLASVMYLIQTHRLKAKVLPGRGMPLLSLERLEAMNRRAIVLAFPLLTAGMIIGLALLVQDFTHPPTEAKLVAGWKDPLVLNAVILWLVFALLLYLRFGQHVRGRNTAVLTIAAFAMLMLTLATRHTLSAGSVP